MSTSDLPLLPRPNISDVVYDILKAQILSRHFAPGERLNLGELEQQMGVSRTPLKDALSRLAVEGLIEIESRKGTFVTNPTLDEIAESFEVRCVLEVYAVELAARRMTESQFENVRSIVEELRQLTRAEDWDQIYQKYVRLDYNLHRLIMEIAGNKRLKHVWEQVNVHGQMARIRYGTAEGQLDLAQKEHEEILHAFETRNIPQLQQAMSRHIERAKQSTLQDLEQHKPK